MFQKEISQKHENGSVFSKMGGVNSNWAHSEDSGEKVAFGGSNPTRLGEMDDNHLPCSPTEFSLEISEEKRKKGKSPIRGVSITLRRCFRNQFHGSSFPFFVVLRLFFIVLRSSTGKFSKSNLSILSMHP